MTNTVVKACEHYYVTADSTGQRVCVWCNARETKQELPPSKELFPDPEKDLFSDAMDAAASAFHSTRYGIVKNSALAGEPVDGERTVRRSLAAAFKAYVAELGPTHEPPAAPKAIDDIVDQVYELERACISAFHDLATPACKKAKDIALAELVASIRGLAPPPGASEDTARLNYLDSLNQRLNAQQGSSYGWKLEINQNRVALWDWFVPALTVREAIDAHRATATKVVTP